jgi:hypothetical protein
MTEEQIRSALAARSPEIIEVAVWFAYDHIADPYVRGFSQQCYDLAANLINDLPDSGMLLMGLTNLLIAKDAFVRAAIDNKSTRGV